MLILRLVVLIAVPIILYLQVLRIAQKRRRDGLGYWVSVHGGEWHVVFHEALHSLSMDFEMGGFGHPDILYVPTEEEWTRSMPEWARDRRREIMERVMGELGTKSWIYDGFEP